MYDNLNRMYWGYAFEAMATERNTADDDQGFVETECVDANVEFCALIKTKLGPHRIIMGAEMDCYDATRDGKRHFIELKTSREVRFSLHSSTGSSDSCMFKISVHIIVICK